MSKLTVALVATCAAVAMVVGVQSVAESKGNAPEATPVRGKAKKEKKLSHEGKEFMKKASLGNLFEVELGKVAKEKAADTSVKKFGERMIMDHTTLQQQLMGMAQSKGAKLPDKVSFMQRRKIKKLKKLSGAKFDQTYMDRMVDEHRTDVKFFQQSQKKVKDSELRTWIDRSLPVLRSHLKQAQNIRTRLMRAAKR